ncbi:MAG: 4-fold beta flower protein [Verrucomicrobiia bacterium]
MTEFLYNSSGTWLAFRRSADDKYVFGVDGWWIGWMPWDDGDIVDKGGKYLATIIGDRLVAFAKPTRWYAGYPGYPGFPGPQNHPGFAPFCPLPPGGRDVTLPKKK